MSRTRHDSPSTPNAWSRVATLLSAVTLALVVAACGGGSGGSSSPPPAVLGTWVLDVDRTLAASAPGTITASAEAARDARLRAVFTSDGYRLMLATDSTFRLDMSRGSTPFHVAGTWSTGVGQVLLTVIDVGGTTLSAAERPLDTLIEDGDGLRLENGGKTLYLRRP